MLLRVGRTGSPEGLTRLALPPQEATVARGAVRHCRFQRLRLVPLCVRVERPRVRAVEEGADRDVHGGSATAAPRPQVPQQVPVQHGGALQASPLSQEQQRSLTPGPGGSWGDGASRKPVPGVFSSGAGAFWRSLGVRGSVHLSLGPFTAGRTQDAEVLLIGAVTAVRPRAGLPPFLSASCT